MGIVTSTFASLAIRLAWNCQRLLDPRYRCIESKKDFDASQPVVSEISQTMVINKSTTMNVKPDDNTLHKENRNRRAAQLRRKKRPSSFDTALIRRNVCRYSASYEIPAMSRVTTSTPSSFRSHVWNGTTSSGCSSDSGSDINSDLKMLRINKSRDIEDIKNTTTEEDSELKVSAADEEAFRLTVGRGHFSRSNKDRFLNHLRMEKRLNYLNNKYFTLACQKNGYAILGRRYSGDLHRMI